MKDKLKGAAIATAVVGALGLGGAAIAGAAGSGGNGNATGKTATKQAHHRANAAARDDSGRRDDNKKDKPITGQALQHAKEVALKTTGGGKVTDSEINDEEGAYEVEVTRADGSQVDVHLDKGFNVLDQPNDGHKGDESGKND
jgi:hypothetical protein